jgi:hypothetical protein
MVPVPQSAKPALSKRVVLLPYKTRMDLICNPFLERILTFWAIDKMRRRLFGSPT